MFTKLLNLKIKNLYYFIVLLVILDSMHAWFFWPFNRFLVTSIFALLTISFALLYSNIFCVNKKQVIILALIFIIARFIAIRGNTNAFLGAIINSSNIVLFIFLCKTKQIEAIQYLTKYLGIIMSLSLLAWILFLFGVSLPSFPDGFGYSEIRNEVQYSFNNHYLFLEFTGNKDFDVTTLPILRFSSIILEPGYLGILIVVLLYINNFELKKWYNIVFLIALILSFSLAGWLFAIYSYVTISLKNSKNKFSIMVSILISLILFNWFFSTYNKGDNVVNTFILERLKFDESKGTIAGYNRTVENFDFWFENSFMKSSNIIWGTSDYAKYFAYSTNVGWKPYVSQYGFLGLGLYFLFLFYWYYRNRCFKTFGFMILYIIIFLRGHHEIFWAAFPILYVGGIRFLSLKNTETPIDSKMAR